MNPKKNKRRCVWLLAGYLILLGISHVVRRNTPAETPLTNGKQLAFLLVGDSDHQTGRQIQLAYREFSGFKIVELNGITSEATHIYDPQNSLLYGYGVLMKQWRMAFEIGKKIARPVSRRLRWRGYYVFYANKMKGGKPEYPTLLQFKYVNAK